MKQEIMCKWMLKNPHYYKQNNLKDILIYLLKAWMYTVP